MEDISFTLNSSGVHAVAYRISSWASNAMLSDNPHSGINEIQVSRTLDSTIASPNKGQGGVVIVQPMPSMKTNDASAD